MNKMATKELFKFFPKYKAHKIVSASKIKDIEIISSIDNTPVCGYITLMEPQGVTVRVDAAFLQKHRPDTGGYLLGYEDSYLSYSPEKTFEECYSLVNDTSENGTTVIITDDNGVNINISGSVTISAGGIATFVVE